MAETQQYSDRTYIERPEIKMLFEEARSRHLTNKEFDKYLALLPANTKHVEVAKDVMKIEKSVVKATVTEVFALYPYAKFHEAGSDKCVRDVTYVSIYATHAMLLEDTDWFKDILLYWMKTIIQAFEFPEGDEETEVKKAGLFSKPVENPYPDVTRRAKTMPAARQSIFDTYARLGRHYNQSLPRSSWELMKPPFLTALQVLSSE